MSDFIVGQHEQAIRTLVTDVREVKVAVGRIEGLLSERRGERRVTLWVVTAISAIAGAVSGLVIQVMR